MPTQQATKTVCVPEALFDYWKPEDEVSRKLTELSVLELLREKRITSSRAAELLNVPIHDVLDLMGSHQVPYLDYAPGDVRAESALLAGAIGR
ncbi:MAG: UPF0175 family protein [Parcubacteria group bacterium]|nr:UPF0175 family protein [Parcubacteria group bacterium]